MKKIHPVRFVCHICCLVQDMHNRSPAAVTQFLEVEERRVEFSRSVVEMASGKDNGGPELEFGRSAQWEHFG